MGINDRGILYCAIGKIHYQQAVKSAQTARRLMPNLAIAIYTDQAIQPYFWQHVIQSAAQPDGVQPMIHKLEAILSSPFEQTLYLDADTLVLDHIDEVFTLLQRFDMAYCHGHKRQKRYNLQLGIDRYNGLKGKAVVDTNIPYSFSPIQGGVILFSASQTKVFFEEVKEEFLTRNYFDDQAIMRDILWKSELRQYVLPPEYNIYSLDYLAELKKGDFCVAMPKIFHYTDNKKDDIEFLIHKIYNCEKVNTYRTASNQKIWQVGMNVLKNYLKKLWRLR